MRVSRLQAAENRRRVIDVASRLFRKHGVDGIGLNDLMKSAGLTQGGFYKQFESKEGLAAEACERAMERGLERWTEAAAKNPDDPLGSLLDFYFSAGSRDEREDGCPVAALAVGAWRHGDEMKATVKAGVERHLDVLDGYLPPSDTRNADTTKAALAMMVGALVISRAVGDEKLSKAFLRAASKSLKAMAG